MDIAVIVELRLNMFRILPLISINLLIVLTQEQCNSPPSFNNIWVRIYKNGLDNTIDQRIRNCITPQTLQGYKENDLLGVKINNQDIPILHKGTIANFQDAFSITMEGNKMYQIKREAFLNLTGVRTISLISNNIESVETKAFTDLPSLLYINLEKNHLSDLSAGTFNNLPKLERLELGFNNLINFKSEWFINVSNLKALTVSNNQITVLSQRYFTNLGALENIDFRENRIETIDKNTFTELGRLNILNLDKNNIRNFDVSFSRFSGLLQLSLAENHINYLPEHVLRNFGSLKGIVIHSNPLQCACYNQINRWAIRNKVFINWKCKEENPVCVTPKNNPEECIQRQDFQESQKIYENGLEKCN